MKLSTTGSATGRRAFWTAGGAQIIMLLLFVAIVTVIARFLPSTLNGASLTIAGVIVAIVPAVVWLTFFYQQDHLEREPKGYVLRVFILGALLASAIGIPVVRTLFHVNSWLYTSELTNLLGSILVIGFTQEFLKYAAVRYSVFDSAEFDERTDGIIYATAAGLGFATMLNFDYVISRGGVDLGIGVIRVTITALAHASIAGVVGYFLGQAKFERTPIYYLPSGIVLAAVLNGVFFWSQDLVTRAGIAVNPWYGLILAVAVALVLLVVVFWLIRRATAETIALARR
jgi:RsiW-degrading membrane proteinase PrsW (M82 family)